MSSALMFGAAMTATIQCSDPEVEADIRTVKKKGLQKNLQKVTKMPQNANITEYHINTTEKVPLYSK